MLTESMRRHQHFAFGALVSTQVAFCPKGMHIPSLGQANRAFAMVAPPQGPYGNEEKLGQRPCTTFAFDEAFVHGRWPIPPVLVCGPWAMPKAMDVNGRWPKPSTLNGPDMQNMCRDQRSAPA